MPAIRSDPELSHGLSAKPSWVHRRFAEKAVIDDLSIEINSYTWESIRNVPDFGRNSYISVKRMPRRAW